jgi:hypothetical protein
MAFFTIGTDLRAGETNPPYLKSMSDYVESNSNDFFTYWEKGTKKEETHFISIDKDLKTNKPKIKIVSGGSYPSSTVIESMAKSLSYISGLFSYDPKNDFSVETISFHFSHSKGNTQSTVCNVKHYTQCGYADITACATMEGNKGYGSKGYSADSLGHNFIYNQDLFARCTSRDPNIVQSRLHHKIIETKVPNDKVGKDGVSK